MSTNWPNLNHNYVPEYQQSVIPYVTSSVTTANGITSVTFPYVARWVVISNQGTSATRAVSDNLAFGFSLTGSNGGNKFIVQAGQTTPRLEVKCTTLFFSGSSSAVPFSILAGLTNIPAGSLPAISASNGVLGVG
jgi:hypothetical protein